MSEMPEEARFEISLREGLRALPVPDVAPDFDARILAGLMKPAPWWQAVLEPLRAILPVAACALVAMLLLIHLSAEWPVRCSPAAAIDRTDIVAFDPLLERSDLSKAALLCLTPLGALSQDAPQKQPENNSTSPAAPVPGRRSQLSSLPNV